ncbi:MAG: serpin family protein [Chloroflexi bacterium]|nr:serpin family protein [Chloroflexota bacterium]
MCGGSTYRSIGGKDICPSCGYGSTAEAVAPTRRKVETRPETGEVEKPDPRLILANTRFGFKLFAEIVKQDPGKNVFISPSSIAFALAMIYNGSRGETQQAMAATMELQEITLQEVNRANAVLMATLVNIDPKVQLVVANSLWARKGITFKPEFMQSNQDFYQAEVADLSSVSVINSWVREKTKGKITQIIEKIDSLAILFLINAIYFRGNWSVQFDKVNTHEGLFALLDGRQKKLPMMSQSGRYSYYQGKGFQAASLPYGQGRVSMYIFLPSKNSSLAEFQNGLTVEKWEWWMSKFHETNGDIVLPRFKLEYEVRLNNALQTISMGVAFDENRADFGNMCPIPPTPNVYISEVKHKTFVEVNEEGTEAAAVTPVEMSMRAVEKTFSLKVDRPFFCAIRDNQTETVLFMGSIVEPY